MIGKKKYPSDRYLISWTNASKLCKEAGGYLPHFSDREELEELVALLKLSETIPPVEGLFLGLRLNGSNKVRYSMTIGVLLNTRINK